MTKYAEGTEVSIDQSLLEIRTTLKRYGATKILFFDDAQSLVVNFEMRSRLIRFNIKLPPVNDFAKTPERRIQRSAAQMQQAWEQACRQCYRALLLVIKAKLESIESEIETFDQAFMAHVVLPSGETTSSWLGPQIEQAYKLGQMPPMLALPSTTRKD